MNGRRVERVPYRCTRPPGDSQASLESERQEQPYRGPAPLSWQVATLVSRASNFGRTLRCAPAPAPYPMVVSGIWRSAESRRVVGHQRSTQSAPVQEEPRNGGTGNLCTAVAPNVFLEECGSYDPNHGWWSAVLSMPYIGLLAGVGDAAPVGLAAYPRLHLHGR